MFHEQFHQYDWEAVKASIYAKTAVDVVQALQKPDPGLEDLKALLSPAAAPYLEAMARQSQARTQQRFGKTVQLYVPLYLSNECQNICTYCAFSLDNKIPRRTLTEAEILRETAVLKDMGYEHVLLVTGESSHSVGVDYLKKAIQVLRPHFAHIAMEVQPLDQPEYELLMAEGLNTVLVYQETYHPESYRRHHPKGRKAHFGYRLDTPDRLGRAGIHKMGLGVLIGLEDWRTDCFFTALHLDYLEKTYWQTKYSLSFPRLRPIVRDSGGQTSLQTFGAFMSDRELVQLICAYRIWNGEVELSLSTRERETFRDHAIQLGITSISAGSRTNPGGYAVAPQSLEQFEISDERSPEEIARMISRQGYEPVWKDWDPAMESSPQL